MQCKGMSADIDQQPRARLVVGRFLNVSLFMIHVPILDLISDPLLPDISTELVLVALYSLVYWMLRTVLCPHDSMYMFFIAWLS